MTGYISTISINCDRFISNKLYHILPASQDNKIDSQIAAPNLLTHTGLFSWVKNTTSFTWIANFSQRCRINILFRIVGILLFSIIFGVMATRYLFLKSRRRKCWLIMWVHFRKIIPRWIDGIQIINASNITNRLVILIQWLHLLFQNETLPDMMTFLLQSYLPKYDYLHNMKAIIVRYIPDHI